MPTRGSGDVSTAAEARAALHAAVQQLAEAEGVVAAEQELRRVLEQLAEQQPAACSAATAAPAKQGRDGVPLSHGPLSGSEEAANTGKPGDAAAVSQEEEEEERLPVAPETSLCDVRPDLPLSAAAVARYSRQLLLPCFGMACQLRLRAASALVVGAGGLGSPVIAYLAGAGIGRLGVVDGDVVEVSNLHRQVIHGGTEPGVNKAVSARRAVGRLNPDVECSAYTTRFTAANADELVSAYDVVIDASDNLLTRYMVNDACVLHRKPLVSGAAIGSEGQVSVYNHGDDGLCYRCLFPEPPPAATVSSCSEHGVLGMVPGVVGCMQALEALKLLSGPTAAATPDLGPPPPRSPPRSPPPGMRGAASLSRRLCIFDALACEFRSIKLPRRSPTCAVCAGRAKAGAPHGAGAGAGAVPIMSNGRPIIRSMAESYAWCELRQLASPKACVRPQLAPQLPARHRITCREYLARVQQQQQQQTPPQTPPPSPPAPPWLLLDVREAVQFAICALPHAVNIPLRQLMEAQPAGGGGGGGSGGGGGRLSPRGLSRVGELAAGRPVYVVCRRGVDSVTAVQQLLAATAAAAPGGEGEGEGEGGRRRRGLSAAQMILNIDGGLQEWHRSVDPTFPLV